MNEFLRHGYGRMLAAIFAELIEDLAPDGQGYVEVVHEPDCSLFDGGFCDCFPEITVQLWPEGASDD